LSEQIDEASIQTNFSFSFCKQKQNPEQADAIDAFIQKLVDYSEVKFPFTMIVDDMSGNSFVENYLAPAADPQLKVEHYERSEYQNGILGINPEIHAKLNATASSIRPKDLQFTIVRVLPFFFGILDLLR
jgi:regulator of sigma D